MLSLQDDWISFHDTPLLYVKPGQCLFESGCGNTAMRKGKGMRAFGRDRLRPVRHLAAACRTGPDGGRILLASGRRRQTLGVALRIEADDRVCRIRAEGLPWDHNRIRFRLSLPGGDVVHPGGAGVMQGRRYAVWADNGNPAPVNGIWTDSGIWAVLQSRSLAIWRMEAEDRAGGGHACLCVESWDPVDMLVVGLADGGPSAEAFLMAWDAANNGLTGELTRGRGVPVASGGLQAIRRQVASTPSPLLWIEDWQGMRRTLLSKTSNCSWRSDPDLYGGLPGLVRELAEQGIQAAIHVMPLLNLDSELCREAVVRGYCLVGRNGRCFEDRTRENPVVWLDLTQPACAAWLQETMRTLAAELGVRAVVAHLDEPFPVGASAQGGDAITLRNGWAGRWLAVCRQAFGEDPGMQVISC